jgi:2-desacetyl-2-hydroxyethyl bacteriochlorophyllide A dehydrogenase
VPRALVLEGPRAVRLLDEAPRPVGDRDVRVRALMSGISIGTELGLYRGTSAFADRVFDRDLRAFIRPDPPRPAYPATMGYEMLGVVEDVGPGVTHLRPGDLVHAGTPHREEAVLNLDSEANATYPLIRLPQDMPADRGLFVSVAAVALVALHDARLKLGDHIAIVGLGAIGLLLAQMARLAGAGRITVVDPVEGRRELAMQQGADEALDPRDAEEGDTAFWRRGDRGADESVETSGNTGALHDAIAMAGLGGRVVTVGFYQGGAPELRLGEEWHHNRLDMVSSMGAWAAPHRNYPAWDRHRVMRTVVDLLAGGELDVEPYPVRRFAFDDAAEAYRWLDENPIGAVKVALAYEGGDPSGGGAL